LLIAAITLFFVGMSEKRLLFFILGLVIAVIGFAYYSVSLEDKTVVYGTTIVGNTTTIVSETIKNTNTAEQNILQPTYGIVIIILLVFMAYGYIVSRGEL